MGDGETLHYQSGVPSAGADGAAAAEGFFDLATARCVRYTVAVGEREAREGRGGEGDGETNEASGSSRAGEVELVVEQTRARTTRAVGSCGNPRTPSSSTCG